MDAPQFAEYGYERQRLTHLKQKLKSSALKQMRQEELIEKVTGHASCTY